MERQRFVRSFDGTRLFTSVNGSGPTVVLCDGIGCDGFIWQYIKPFLSSKYRVIHWNYRGHGLSAGPAHPEAVGMPALRADLQAVLDAYQVDQAVLVGHSMGVQVILEAALEWPERVIGLIPMCGSYGRPLDTLHGTGRVAMPFPLVRDAVLSWPHFGQRMWRRFFLSSWAQTFAMRYEVNGLVLGEGAMAPYFEHLGGMDARVFVSMLDRIRLHTVEERLQHVAAPTLVIAGERDTFTPAWLSHRMQLHIPGAELLVVPGGTHVAPLEIPELINLRLTRFLEERVFTSAPTQMPVREKRVPVHAI